MLSIKTGSLESILKWQNVNIWHLNVILQKIIICKVKNFDIANWILHKIWKIKLILHW